MIPKKRGLIYFNRNRLDFFAEGMVNPIRLTFTSEIINNLEVIDKIELIKTINTFVKTNHLLPVRLVFVLAETMIFSKKLPRAVTNQNDVDIKAFLDTVPFENISPRLVTKGNETYIMAINADYFTWLKNAFETNGFLIQSTVNYGELVPIQSTKSDLDNSDIQLIMNRFDSLKQFDFDLKPESNIPLENTSINKEVNRSNNQRMVLLGGLLSCLVAILIFLILRK